MVVFLLSIVFCYLYISLSFDLLSLRDAYTLLELDESSFLETHG